MHATVHDGVQTAEGASVVRSLSVFSTLEVDAAPGQRWTHETEGRDLALASRAVEVLGVQESTPLGQGLG